jgi:iron(III) transport system ATP-binding protein
MLRFDKISHHYGLWPSIDDISLNIEEGKVVSLLGPSGCGKSTILRIAAGLEKPSTGSVWIDSDKVAGDDAFTAPEQRRVGLVFQDYALFPHMTVAENILYSLEGVSTDSAYNCQRLGEVLEQVDMTNYAESWPHMLSGGQQQRVALARALAPKPKIMLLDEPYAGLDSRLRERIRDEMLHVLKEAGTTVLMVTHDSEEAMFMSDYIYVMKDGHIQQAGRPIDLYCRPQSVFVAEFFGEVNRIDGQARDGCLRTPLGNFNVHHGYSGTASLVIRHEALIIGSDGNDSVNAEVMETRLLGRHSLIHLSMPTEDGEDVHLHARVPGLNMISPGEKVFLSVDPDQVFVFPL